MCDGYDSPTDVLERAAFVASAHVRLVSLCPHVQLRNTHQPQLGETPLEQVVES